MYPHKRRRDEIDLFFSDMCTHTFLLEPMVSDVPIVPAAGGARYSPKSFATISPSEVSGISLEGEPWRFHGEVIKL